MRYCGIEWQFFGGNEMEHMLVSPQVFFSFSLMNSIKFSQYCLSLVSMLMLMDHRSSSRSLISSPYRPHHFIWPKGNNKSLIHYPLTEAAKRKYLIRGNKLNFNHLEDAHRIKQLANVLIPLITCCWCAFVHTILNAIDNQINIFCIFSDK